MVLLLAALLFACRSEDPKEVSLLRPPRAEQLVAVEDEDRLRREVIETNATGTWEWRVPADVKDGRLRFEWAPRVEDGTAVPSGVSTYRLTAEVLQGEGGEARSVGAFEIERAAPGAAIRFGAADAGLGDVGRGSRVRLRLEPAATLLLSDVRIVPRGRQAAPVILVVFDTVRADAVGFGGARHPSTPNLDSIAREGWTSSRAYAAASWTVPSVASMLTGLVPAAHEDSAGSPLGIVPGVTTIADDFRATGWSTAAFVANPTLHAGMGFAQGFDTFFTTPYEEASILLPAPATIGHVLPWIAKHEGEPFFIWIHVLDPHDPYMPPDRPRGTTPFDPDYSGTIAGDEVHGLYLGDKPAPAPRDVRHLEALYQDEVRFADGELGKLWDALPEDLRQRATVVFTSDHGEELGEHGGWKHGPALWEPVLRVPLFIRPGEGRPQPAIARDLPVSLLDLVPTLLELAQLPEARRPLDGLSVFDPRIATRKALPPITMLTGGAPRAVVIRGSSKLIFFDRLNRRNDPDRIKDPDGWRLAQRLPSLLPALGSFDLAGDSGESKLRPVEAVSFPTDWRAIETSIAHTHTGIEFRLLSSAGAEGVELGFDGIEKGSSFEPFALEADDRLERTGERLVFASSGGSDVDGFLLHASARQSLGVTMRSGRGCVELVAGERTKLAAGSAIAIDTAKLATAIPRLETTDSRCSGLFIWRAEGGKVHRSEAQVDEERSKLRAIGYVH